MRLSPKQDPAGVSGYCAPRFAQVRLEFERNFAARGELGASVCIVHEGVTVVDLWGGTADPQHSRPWTADTLVVVHSATKGAVALCAHILASAGELNLDVPVARYWPSFSSGEKSTITTRHLLNHQAGLPGVSFALEVTAVHDFDAMVRIIEREQPLWQPGTRHGYHPLTFGWLVGEVIRRVTGMSVGAFLQQNVTGPLGVDFWIGLPTSEEHRVADTVMRVPGIEVFSLTPEFRVALAQKEPTQVRTVNSFGGFLDPGGCDAPGAHSSEIPAVNGIASARGLASLYAPLSIGGRMNGVVLVSEDQVAEMGSTESSAAIDAVLLCPSRFTPGFEKASYGRSAALDAPGFVISEAAFGYTGMGGSVGFADPQGRFSFGYVMNRHPGASERVDARYQPLIDATYRSLGYRSRVIGRWR